MMSRCHDNCSLRAWINNAIGSIQSTALATDNRFSAFGADLISQALSSDEFILSGLRVARSLADEICRAEGEAEDASACASGKGSQDGEDHRNGDGKVRHRVHLPAMGADWADRIVVHFSSTSTANDNIDDNIDDNGNDNGNGQISQEEENFNMLPLSLNDPSAKPDDLPSDLGKWMEEAFVTGNTQNYVQESLALNRLSFSSQPQRPTTHPDMLPDEFDSLFDDTNILETEEQKSYLSVTSAKFLPPSNISNGVGHNCDRKDEAQRIYFLGLVLYEIFSGGVRPLGELDAVKQYASSDRSKNGSPSKSNGNNHGPQYHNGTMDVFSNLNILEDLGGSGDAQDVDNIGEQNPKKRTIQRSDNTISVSVELLKAKGVPWSLCDLIANMIDCANGDLSGDESYSHMVDVSKDLSLMLDKPDKYLKDLDLVKISMTGLPFTEGLCFGREKEMGILQDSYRRSISGENELAIISGTSGSGKSVLANQLGSFVTKEGGLFLSGKFDHLQIATPFSAITSALNQYIDILAKERESTRTKMVAKELKASLGREGIFHLAKVIPHLNTLLGQDKDGKDKVRGCVDAQKRLTYLLCRFVEVISRFSGAESVTLFLDDLHWADSSSIEVIKQFLLVSNTSEKFYFVGCCREVVKEHPISMMLSGVNDLGVCVTSIKLTRMDEDTICALISNMLCLPPRLIKTLANAVYHKTKGLPLFVTQLMASLKKDGLLWLSLTRRRWEWDEEKIQSSKLPGNVANFFASTISLLPVEVQLALSLLSCFGSCTECALIKTLESELSLSLVEPLETALEEGLLDKTEGRVYHFSHDDILEAAYNLVPPEERPLLHFKYGIALASVSLGLNNDNMLFIATGQLNRGGPMAAKGRDEGVTVARLNLAAGKKAMEMSDFSSAYNFFDNGISFLRKGHWKNQYDLSLDLFENAAKCALAIGDLISLKLLAEQVFAFARTFEEKLDVTYITIGGLAYAHKLPDCIQKATSVLNHLGENIPESYTESDTKSHIELTRGILDGFTDEELLGYKLMEDPNKVMAMKFYSRLETAMQNARPDLQPIVTLKMVQLSITYGLSPVSPVGFAYYGMLLARLGHIREGYRFVKVARNLLDRLGSTEVAGEVIFIATQITCFVESVQSANDFHLEGHHCSMIAGDVNNALANTMFYTIGSAGSGVHLQKVKERFTNARRSMEQNNHLTWIIAMTPIERSVLTLIGTEKEEMPVENNLQETSPYPSLVVYLNNVFIYFMFRKYDEMKLNAEKYHSCEKLKSWSLLYSHTKQELFGGLSSYWIYRKTKDPAWLERGQKSKAMMKDWADSSQWNFASEFHLLEAEDFFCNANYENAKLSYEKAISFAIEHRFINDEAVACELAGYFFLDQGNKEAALNYFGQAHSKYFEWGALAKANTLYESILQKFASPASLCELSSVEPSISPIPGHDGHSKKSSVRKRASNTS